MGNRKARPICPECGERAERTVTKYGIRNACCGLHSWGYKPLVHPDIHVLRREFHRVFDPIWKAKKMGRGMAYRVLSEKTGLPEPECHGAKQEDAGKLRRLIGAASEI